MGIRNYAPTEVNIILGGFYELTGFTEGSFISISKDERPYKLVKTADGRVARSYMHELSYTITLKLASTSPSNEVLSRLHQADVLTQLGKFPIFVKDNLGTSLFLSPTAWVSQIPDLDFSDGVTERSWVIQATQGSINIGGNRDATDELDQTVALITGSVPSLKSILG